MPKPPKPTLCALLVHIVRRIKRIGLKGRPLAGIILILVNVPFGWGGPIICIALANITGQRWPYICGTAIYALSWLILFLGIYLAGKEIYKRVKAIIPSAFKVRRRLK